MHADDFCSRTHSIFTDGFGAAKVSSRGPRRPKARRAFADPFASLFQWAATTLHTDCSALSEKPPTLWRGVRRRTRALRWEECSVLIR